MAASFAAAASGFAFASALAVVELRRRFRRLGGGLLLRLLGPRPGLIRLCGGERLLGARELGVGADFELFQLAQRRRKRCCLAHCRRGGFLRLVGRPGGLHGLADERLGACRRSRERLRIRHQERRVGELDRRCVVRRDDHPHPDPRLAEELFGKAERHPHAAVRGRIPGQRPAVQRDAVPGDALHVRHVGIVIHVRAVVLFPLDDGEDAGRRLAFLGAGRHRRAQNPALGVVERDLLRLDRDDRHDRLTGIARRRRLFGWWRGARLSRGGVGGQRRQRGHRGERREARTPRDCASNMLCPVERDCARLRRSRVKPHSVRTDSRTDDLNPVAPALFNLDARELDHLAPLFDGVREDRPEFRRRAPKRRAAKLGDPLSDLGIGDAGIELLVEQCR